MVESPASAGPAAVEAPLLDVRQLKVHFPFRKGSWFWSETGFVRAVDGVSFTVRAGETLGLVGESGCGKTTTARALVGLTQPTSGEVWLDGERLDGLSESAMRPYRRKIQMIFQDPFASLNPRMTVGAIIAEPLAIMRAGTKRDRQLEAVRVMDLVGLNPRFLNRYPHEFSGGQRQRVGIARALILNPKLVVCDEPVSALDVSIQAQVIQLLMELQQKLGVAYLFIAHDLAVVRHIAHRVGVMYLGRIVELGATPDIFASPQHPYTQALLSAAPLPDPAVQRGRKRIVLRGEVPRPDREYPGCPFADRCPIVDTICREQVPQLVGTGRQVSCLKVALETETDVARSFPTFGRPT